MHVTFGPDRTELTEISIRPVTYINVSTYLIVWDYCLDRPPENWLLPIQNINTYNVSKLGFLQNNFYKNPRNSCRKSTSLVVRTDTKHRYAREKKVKTML